MIYRVLPVAAFIAVVVAGWLALYRSESGVGSSAPGVSVTQNPGYSARNAQLIETGPDGKPMYTLLASVIRQQPAAQIVTLDDVRMQLRDPSGNLWSGRADHGQVLEDSARIELLGGVKLWGLVPGGRGLQPAQITTNQLFVDTRTDVATTPAPVLLNWAGQLLQGVGLVASLNDRRVKLESDVHGLFNP